MLNQLILNGIVTGSIYLIVALGFGLIYSTSNFFHIAHGIIFTLGAYFTYMLHVYTNLPLSASIISAIILTTAFGCSIEILIYRPLRHKNASALILLLASLGIYIIAQNLVSLVFGDDTKTIRSGMIEEGIRILGARITHIQLITIAVSLLLFTICLLLLKNTKIGLAIRAVANDSELARASGLESDQVVLLTFAIGSALAAIAGILVALDVDLIPVMGLRALLMGVVAVIIGGVGSLPGVALGSFFWEWHNTLVYGKLALSGRTLLLLSFC